MLAFGMKHKGYNHESVNLCEAVLLRIIIKEM
jgi:hypothetical protein